MLGRQDKYEIRCVLLAQWITALFLSGLMLVLSGLTAAQSSLYGSLVSIIPTCVFAGMLFRYQGARQAQRIVRSLYVGEGLKLMITALLFGLVIKYLHPLWWAFFVSFVLVHLSLCVAPLLCVHGLKRH